MVGIDVGLKTDNIRPYIRVHYTKLQGNTNQTNTYAYQGRTWQGTTENVTKAQNNRLIEHFVGGNSHNKVNKVTGEHITKHQSTKSYCHLQSVQSSENGKEVKKNGKSKSNQH